MKIINVEKLLDHIENICLGDTVYLMSDILKLGCKYIENNEKFDIDMLINSIQKKIGSDGNLLIPTFNWDFCKGISFDYDNTPSRVGAVGNRALKRDDFVRTRHPLYSFAVWGKDAKHISELDSIDSFGEDSIFSFMCSSNSKVLTIGLSPLLGCSYIHYIEQINQVPYRYNKEFTAGYIFNGKEKQKTYTMYVRDLELNPKPIFVTFGLPTELSSIEAELADKGLIKSITLNDVVFYTYSLNDITPIIENDIISNEARRLYSFNNK